MLLLGAPLVACSCGHDLHMLVQLVTLADEDPYADVARLVVKISRDHQQIALGEADFTGEAISLPAVRAEGEVAIEARGLAGDLTTVVSTGSTRSTPPKLAESCCVMLCFCTTGTYEAGLCTCGSSACLPQCASWTSTEEG